MLINNIKFEEINLLTNLSADVAFRGNKPERMYFATDLKNESLISTDYSPFLAAVLLPCMNTGEDIYIDGATSKKLLDNTQKIMDLVVGWNVGLKKINVIARSEDDLPTGRQAKQSLKRSPRYTRDDNEVGAFFSAGVDSFYTYLKHKNKKDKIKNLILVHGFDIPLKNKKLFNTTKNIVAEIAREEEVNSIFVETNAGEIIEKHLIWDFAHGGALAAVGLFLGRKLNKIFIPAGLRIDEVFPYGTHPDLDSLWSTELTSFEHDGTEYNRLGKIMNSISKSDLALKHLRVCTQNLDGLYNCGKCYKCLQTMIELVCANALDRAKTFGKLDLKAVSNMYYDYSLLYNLQGEANLSVLKKENREIALQRAIEESLDKSKKKRIDKKLYQLIASLDRKYNKRRLYLSIIKMNNKQNRNIVYKMLMRMRVLK